MKSEIKTFGEVFSNGMSFEVPQYQREYSWGKGQLEYLFEDIKDFLQSKREKELFFGIFIFFQFPLGSKKLQIVDGKQRITTLSLFVMSIVQKLKLAKNISKKSKFEKLRKIIAWNPNGMNLNLYQEEDQKIYRHIWRCIKKEEKIQPVKEWKKSSIWNNFQEIFLFLENYLEKDILKILEFITNKIKFLLVITNENDKPQKIFETLNSTGKEPQVSDLIKNYILSNLAFCNEKDVEEILKMYWDRWVKLLLKIDEKKGTGLETFFNTLIHVVLNNKQPSFTSLNPNQKTFRCFQKFFKEFKFLEESKDIEPYLKWLEKFIILYFLVSNNKLEKDLKNLTTLQKIQNKSYISKISKNNKLKCFGWENKILSLFFSLLLERNIIDQHVFESLMEFTTVYEIILRIWKNVGQLSKEYNIFVEKIKTKLKINENYIFERPGADNSYSVSKNKFKKQILNHFGILLKEKLEGEKELFQNLKNLKNENKFEEIFIKNITQKIKKFTKTNQLKIRFSIVQLTTQTFYKIKEPTIEHIFPQKPIETSKTQSLEADNIGNLIFLEKELNEKCGQKSLTEKTVEYEKSKNPEIRELAKYIKEESIQEWDKNQIEKRRQKKIKQFVQKIKSSGFLEHILND